MSGREHLAVPVWAEYAGWFGTSAVLGAYLALTVGWLEVGWTYQVLNFVGATGIVCSCYYQKAWQALVLDGVWALIALASLVMMALA